MLNERGIDLLVAMRIVGNANYQTATDIHIHVRDKYDKEQLHKHGERLPKDG